MRSECPCVFATLGRDGCEIHRRRTKDVASTARPGILLKRQKLNA
jgi:hypothetical protein